MKKFSMLAVLIVLSASSLFAQKGDCNGYFAYKAGTKFEMTVYDKKDKPSNILKYEVVKNTATTDGAEITYSNESYDSKNKLLSKGEFTAKCQGTQFSTEVRNISTDMLPKSADIQVTVTGDKLVYPLKLSAGQTLPDASVETRSTMNGIGISNISIAITNRKVESIETIETPVGKFEAVKISYSFSTKMTLAKMQGTAVEYLTKDIGLIKSETFDKNGKKVSSQIISKLER